MELITPTTAKVLAYYDHTAWGDYAALTENHYGKGLVTYIGYLPTAPVLASVLEDVVKKAKIQTEKNVRFPLIAKTGVNMQGKQIRYYFNYSAKPISANYTHKAATDLLSGTSVKTGAKLKIAPWDMRILEEN